MTGMLEAYKKADNQVQRIARTIGAVTVIATAMAGIFGWFSNQIQTFVSSQITELKEEMVQTNTEHERTMTRVELMLLMDEDPENTTAIEKIAAHYFQDLNGDLYMTKKYSEWASAHGGDMNIAIRR